jgi:cytosine/uracil/thiamine/allantoin permease
MPRAGAFLDNLFDYAWFVALGLSAAAYAVGMRLAGFDQMVKVRHAHFELR